MFCVSEFSKEYQSRKATLQRKGNDYTTCKKRRRRTRLKARIVYNNVLICTHAASRLNGSYVADVRLRSTRKGCVCLCVDAYKYYFNVTQKSNTDNAYPGMWCKRLPEHPIKSNPDSDEWPFFSDNRTIAFF